MAWSKIASQINQVAKRRNVVKQPGKKTARPLRGSVRLTKGKELKMNLSNFFFSFFFLCYYFYLSIQKCVFSILRKAENNLTVLITDYFKRLNVNYQTLLVTENEIKYKIKASQRTWPKNRSERKSGIFQIGKLGIEREKERKSPINSFREFCRTLIKLPFYEYLNSQSES